ncbi:SacI homology domain-containing protein [Mycotypha africana]|uniref:Sac phosphatase domain-containing protein n=1 Tax=Mycotypha africana TaxID=64632 RepID=UPI0022FFFA07|nr:Sac phosphatase domain-containing protein [Mycotypha africana]KAI8971754.1 SacI homology domain-containing protein [Mycotypha africana]
MNEEAAVLQPSNINATSTEDSIKNNSSGGSRSPSVYSVSTSASDNEERGESDSYEDDEDEILEKRLVKQIVEMLNLTNSFQRVSKRKKAEPTLYANENIPLWKKVDKRFWWNEFMLQDFIKQELDEWIIPIMQGTIHIESCQIEGYGFDFALISRRSRERAGMRYQRRGVNEEGQTANYVETEQTVIFQKDNVTHVASFIQIRGSIPLFWSQSPYSLHPIPVMERTENETKEAFHKHINTQICLYGNLTLINLTELVGREAIVGAQYRRYVEDLAEPNVKYVEFDFHKETKGMKFENISKLSKSLQDDFAKMQYFWEMFSDDGIENTVYSEQTGVFRTNCMDCLDRTNVVQSAFGRTVLNLQLMRFGISEYPEQGIRYYNDFERAFNNAWANNGDMISKMYAGTSALKSDFTRTGKRNITGMMNDASNSLARMYYNTVKDFWRQATVDYILGYHKAEIFRHVLQSTKMSAEPGFQKRWLKIRSEAINISSDIVIADDETRIKGWTLRSPAVVNNIIAKLGPKRKTAHHYREQQLAKKHFEEKIVLLTEKALYVCSYNYKMEKVIQFRRISLDTLVSIQIGEYILSSLTPASRSEDFNYGFVVCHKRHGGSERWNTGSMLNQHLSLANTVKTSKDQRGEEEPVPKVENEDMLKTELRKDKSEADIVVGPKEDIEEEKLGADNACIGTENIETIAFKAIRNDILGESENQTETCKQQVLDIVHTITKACKKLNDPNFIIEKPIISLKQAEKTDGVLKKMGYKLKRAIWL